MLMHLFTTAIVLLIPSVAIDSMNDPAVVSALLQIIQEDLVIVYS